MSLEQVVIIGLAAWRLAYMLVKEDGPFAVFARLRTRLARLKLLECVYCVSVWLAVGGYLIRDIAEPVLVVLAIAAIAAMIQRWLGFDFDPK